MRTDSPPVLRRVTARAVCALAVAVVALSSCGQSAQRAAPVTTVAATRSAGEVVTADPTLSNQVAAAVEAATVTGPRNVRISVFVTDCTAVADAAAELTETQLLTSVLLGMPEGNPSDCGDPHLVSVDVETPTDIAGRVVVLGTGS
jgi:hypothetical protein